MAQSLLDSIVFPSISLLVQVLVLSVPVFLLALFSGMISSRLSKKFRLNWLQSTVVSTYLVVFLLIFFLYLFPVFSAAPEVLAGTPPEGLRLSPVELAFRWIVIFAGLLFKALVFSVLLLPLEFVAALVFDYSAKRISKTAWFNVFVSVYATTLFGFLVLLFNPWLAQGLIFLLYWG